MADIMQRRHSPLVKSVFVIAGVGAVVYLIYLNHDVNTRLKDTDDRAERYRRSHETLSAQLQDLSAAKEDSEKKAQTERDEIITRLNAKSKEQALLKSQNEDLQTDKEKLEDEKNQLNMDLENMRAENKREYEQMKAEKDMEISKLKDEIADQKNSVRKLQTELEAAQEQNRNLQVQYSQSQQLVATLQQENQQISAKLQFAQQNNAQAGNNAAPQQGLLQPVKQPQGGAFVMEQNLPQGGAVNQAAGEKPAGPNPDDQAQQMQIQPAGLGEEKKEGYDHEGDAAAQKEEAGQNAGAEGNAGGVEHKEEDNAQHQVQPPNFQQQQQQADEAATKSTPKPDQKEEGEDVKGNNPVLPAVPGVVGEKEDQEAGGPDNRDNQGAGDGNAQENVENSQQNADNAQQNQDNSQQEENQGVLPQVPNAIDDGKVIHADFGQEDPKNDIDQQDHQNPDSDDNEDNQDETEDENDENEDEFEEEDPHVKNAEEAPEEDEEEEEAEDDF